MRPVSKYLLALLLVVTLVTPGILIAQQLPVPKTVAVFPGVTDVDYAGQTFIITTPVKLSVKFETISWTEIRITVKTGPSHRSGPSPAPTQQILQIYWEDGDEIIYEGEPPSEEWIGIVLSEGGFTEK
jgi:hypothetical protein